MIDTSALGSVGEELARRYLVSKGYKILITNFTCPLGEIDVIAKEGGDLVFIEIKTRTSEGMGHPAEAVTRHKRCQIGKTAAYYLNRYGIRDVSCRFDVVCVRLAGDEAQFELIANAFGLGE